MNDILFDESDLEMEGNYCFHGTFIGNSFGGDYLCGYCEQGVTLAEWELARIWSSFRWTMRNEVLPAWWSAIPADAPPALIVPALAAARSLIHMVA